MKDKLRACPFCGREAVVRVVGYNGGTRGQFPRKAVYVSCPHCHAKGASKVLRGVYDREAWGYSDPTRGEIAYKTRLAVEAWNRRAGDTDAD